MFIEFIINAFLFTTNLMLDSISTSSFVAPPGAWAANFASLLLTAFHFIPYDVFALFVASFLFWLSIDFIVYLYKFVKSLIPLA
jgi:hypothetical protein